MCSCEVWSSSVNGPWIWSLQHQAVRRLFSSNRPPQLPFDCVHRLNLCVFRHHHISLRFSPWPLNSADSEGSGAVSPGSAPKQLTSPSSGTGPPFAPSSAASPEKQRITNEFVEFLNKLRKAAADDISQQIKALFTQLTALRDVEAKSEAMQTFYRHMYERLNTRAIYRGK